MSSFARRDGARRIFRAPLLLPALTLLACTALPVDTSEGDESFDDLEGSSSALSKEVDPFDPEPASEFVSEQPPTSDFIEGGGGSSGSAFPACVYTGTPPAAVGKRSATMRILTQNTFGLDRDGDANCTARAKALGNAIANAWPPYDVVHLQEHWNSLDNGLYDCGASELSNAIWSTGRYRNSNNYYRHRPEGEPWELDSDGGQSIFTLHPVQTFVENEWDDIPGAFNQLQGSTFSRIKLNNTNITVDVYNVHILAEHADDCNESCRRDELNELRDEIYGYSRNSGNPVIVTGDFNMGGPPSCHGTKGYGEIMRVLENPRDLWLETHPGEDGFTADCINNTVLQDVDHCAYQERIDFMFLITSPGLTNSNYQVVASDMQLAKFTRANGKHVSDHFGLDATLDIRPRANPNALLFGLANKCMDVQGASSADGTPVQLYSCNGSVAQQWTYSHLGEVKAMGKCLTLRNGSTANGNVTELRTCDSSPLGRARQRFDYTPAGELRSRLNPNKCIEVRGGFTNDGTPIQVYDCNGTGSQFWQDRPTCSAPSYACGLTCCTPPPADPRPDPACMSRCMSSCRADGIPANRCTPMCRLECAP